MHVLLLTLPVAAFAGSLGVVAGWWWRGKALAERDKPEVGEGHSQEVLVRLHELAARVAADVDEHSSRVHEITKQLSAAKSRESTEVVSAIAKLIDANARMQQQLELAEDKLNEQARQIQSHAAEARTDALTLLENRRAFNDHMARCLAEYRRHGRPLTLMLIDVDHFKQFNDTYGHPAGDEALRGLARVLRRNVRETEIVARYGGEEFATIFPGSTLPAARLAGERLRQAIAATSFSIDGHERRITASAGMAELLPDENEEGLVRRADAALYASKAAGRNCGHWHDGRDCHPVAEPVEAERLADMPRKTAGRTTTRSVPVPFFQQTPPATGENRSQHSDSNECLQSLAVTDESPSITMEVHTAEVHAADDGRDSAALKQH
jgi:diguanylate cyclase